MPARPEDPRTEPPTAQAEEPEQEPPAQEEEDGSVLEKQIQRWKNEGGAWLP